MAEKRKTGTREWADSNYNIGIGCSHDCLYCYARTNALRYKYVAEGDWTTERVKGKLPAVSKKNGVIMFPTTHDISPFYLPVALDCLKKLLAKGNKVLIVSKPHMICVEAMCRELEPWKNNILFRFTIDTSDSKLAKFWEPNAPSIEERVNCLRYSFDNGFSTSVSMEPILGSVEDTFETFRMMEDLVTDKIWVGKMNKINARVKKSSPEIAAKCEETTTNQTDDKILWLVNAFKDNPKIEWKDSIKEVIEKYAINV